MCSIVKRMKKRFDDTSNASLNYLRMDSNVCAQIIIFLNNCFTFLYR